MFYFWAKNQINSIDTPFWWLLMRPQIRFFRQFEVQKNLKEMQSFFWLDENTETAKAWISTYKDDIQQIEEKYKDQGYEKTYAQHMEDMRLINASLKKFTESE